MAQRIRRVPININDDEESGGFKMNPIKGFLLIGSMIVGALLALTVVFGSWYTVTQGEVGVIYRNGQIIGTADPGLHFKLPIVDSVEHINLKTMKITYDNVSAYTSDQQTSNSKITVIWHLDPAAVVKLVSTAGPQYWSTLIAPVVPTYYKSVINSNDAAKIIVSREKIAGQVTVHAAEQLLKRGIVLESVQVENVDFSKEYEKAVEAAVQSRALVTKAEQDLARQKITAEQTVVDAKAKADAEIEHARGSAESRRLTSIAEAEAVQRIGDALAKNPALVAKITAEKWDGKLPTTMVPGSALPFVNVAPATK